MQFSGGLINVVEWQQKAVADIPGAEGFDTDRYFFKHDEICLCNHRILVITM